MRGFFAALRMTIFMEWQLFLWDAALICERGEGDGGDLALAGEVEGG